VALGADRRRPGTSSVTAVEVAAARHGRRPASAASSCTGARASATRSPPQPL